MSDINAVNHIHCGDIRDIAKTLPAQSVNCIVTSPPYFGLRDYQTAEWEGGRVKCDHSPCRQNPTNGSTLDGGKSTTGHAKEGYKSYCPKCGAKRIDKQIGLEETPEAYVDTLVGIFRELKRVLRDDGTVWLNLGDSYSSGLGDKGQADGGKMNGNSNRPDSGLPPKNLIGIPWRVAFALQADGWILRSDIIWHKKNPMPESVTDRPTKAHEYIFLLSKKPRYYYDNEAVREPNSSFDDNGKRIGGGVPSGVWINAPENIKQNHGVPFNPHPLGRNRRTVWTVSTKPYKAAHFAVFPPDLIRPCILAGCPQQVCSECGEPWVRVVEKARARNGATPIIEGREDKLQGNTAKLSLPRESRVDASRSGMGTPLIKTIGWQPACDCKADRIPGIVLDPFMGSGTVAQVAIETGRNWLGVELNPEYIELAKERIYQTQPPLPIEAY